MNLLFKSVCFCASGASALQQNKNHLLCFPRSKIIHDFFMRSCQNTHREESSDCKQIHQRMVKGFVYQTKYSYLCLVFY